MGTEALLGNEKSGAGEKPHLYHLSPAQLCSDNLSPVLLSLLRFSLSPSIPLRYVSHDGPPELKVRSWSLKAVLLLYERRVSDLYLRSFGENLKCSWSWLDIEVVLYPQTNAAWKPGNLVNTHPEVRM